MKLKLLRLLLLADAAILFLLGALFIGAPLLAAGKPKDPDLRKTFMLRIRMTEADRLLIEEAARTKSLEMSTWARSELVALAKRLIAKQPR